MRKKCKPFGGRNFWNKFRAGGLAGLRWSLVMVWFAALVDPVPGPGRLHAQSAPAVPAGPSTPSVPSVPSASSGASPTEAPVIPGYGPGDALPGSAGTIESPQIELIPPGVKPLQLPLQPDGSPGSPAIFVPDAAPIKDPKSLRYPVSKFMVKYGPPKKDPHPGLPPVQQLADTSVTLGEAKPGEYVAPGGGTRDVPIVLSKFQTVESFSADALQTIALSVSGAVNKKGIYGVFVVADPDEIDPSTGEDLRKGGTELTFLVYASEVKQVRTIVKPVPKAPFGGVATTIQDPKYQKIADKSPLKGPQGGKPGSLLMQSTLQNYLDRINRFPARRVDVAVSASGEEAGVVLDYIVHVEKPSFFLFNQTSNTGTQASGQWRNRTGFELRQFAGLDDLLDGSFETSLSSTDTYSGFLSYQIAAIFPDVLKVKVYGGYGKFLAEDVGFDEAGFRGKSATAGLLSIFTPYYFKGFPIDLLAGVEYRFVNITDVSSAQDGASNFFLPYAGIATDRVTDLYSAFGNAQIQFNIPDAAGTDSSELQQMGRLNVDRQFIVAKYALGGSLFLEPLIFRKDWQKYEQENDPSKRKAMWPRITNAHELSLAVHGQYIFDDKRVIPQFEDVVGGFVSVRGYPEAYAAGDDSVVLNAEYRFHLPRIFRPLDTDVDPKKTVDPAKAPKFALRPPTILGRPDLDVIFRLFYDLGYVENNNLQTSLEANRLLSSIGAGVEVQVSRYLNLRADWGFVLSEIDDNKTSRPVHVGDNRISFVGVITY